MKENTTEEVELQHSQPSPAISNTRWRLEPGDARDGLNNRQAFAAFPYSSLLCQ